MPTFACKKLEAIGFEQGDDSSAAFLNRVVAVEKGERLENLVCEPDGRNTQSSG